MPNTTSRAVMKFIKSSKLSAEALEDPMIIYETKDPENSPQEDILNCMRARAGLTQAEVAKRLGLTPPAVSRLEKRFTHASFKTLKRYAEACGFDLRFYYK
ncbi:helix-turn-helix domain-containing protein [Klebsiella sp. R445]